MGSPYKLPYETATGEWVFRDADEMFEWARKEGIDPWEFAETCKRHNQAVWDCLMAREKGLTLDEYFRQLRQREG